MFIEVEGMDRGGSFIGRLTTVDRQSAALLLIKAGLAKVHASASTAPDYQQLLEAQEECKRSRIGVWTNYEEPQVTVEEIQSEGSYETFFNRSDQICHL